jgi:ribosomal-protein-alanine N-acetyltransferase
VNRGSKSVLTGGRVSLRPLANSDFPAWSEVRRANRDWLERWEPRPEPGAPDPAVSQEAFRARCGAWDRQRQFDAAYGFGIFVAGGDRFVGEVSLGSVQRGPFQAASVGYWIDERAAGRGYVPEAVAVVFRYAFEELGLHRLEIAIVPRNAPSRRVVEKLGLREEGVAIGYLQIAGVYEDHLRFAITADEWRTRRDEMEAVATTT